jgi:predicted amidohydrolase YtcJ
MSNPTADLILYNANVITLHPSHPESQLIAIQNGKILSMARNDALKEFTGAKTKAIDCHGKTVLPGFNDAHCHLVAFVESLLTPNLGPDAVHSISDIKDKIRKLAQDLRAGNWIRAGGYNEFYLVEKRHPTRWDLDEATTNHPVKLTHRSGHAQVLNSPALSLAGISKETPEPPGGMIERDLETGEPTGLLYGMSNYIAKVVSPISDSELEQGIKLANKKLLALGITSLQDASQHNDIQRWQMFQQWKNQGCLKPRVNMMLGAEAFNLHHEHNLFPRAGNDELRLGAIKIILDETRGQLNPPQAELNQKVLAIHQSGFQVAMHAVEETTIEAACLALEYVLKVSPNPNHRHRIEHCSVCTPAMAKRLALLDVVVVTQPAFIYYNGERYLKTVQEKQRKHLYRIATLIKAGLKLSASSDCPVIPPDPASGIYATVSRMTESGQSLLPGERVSQSQALWMYTGASAYACFEENIKGTMAPGKLADLIVLNRDPTEMTPEEIKDLEVEMTVIGGGIVWRKEP